MNVPGTLAVAFNCADESAVPYAMAGGVVHVSGGVVLLTTSVAVAVAGL
jgi:hypothetical protein